MTDWFRSWHGAPTDPKWVLIARKAGVAPAVASAIAWALFDHASQSKPRGNVSTFDCEVYAAWGGLEESSVYSAVEAMKARGMIQADGMLTNWRKRQPEREDGSAERAKAWREGKRTQANAEERTPNARDRTETEADTEKKELGVSDETLVPAEPGTLRVVVETDEQKAKAAKRKAEVEFFQDVVAEWNVMAEGLGLPSVKDITDPRQSMMRARASDLVKTYEYPTAREGFRELFAKIRGSPFLTGGTKGKDFRCDFDFAVNSSSFTKIMEGKYEARQAQRR